VLQDNLVVSLNNGKVISAMGSMSFPNVNPGHLEVSDIISDTDVEVLLKNQFGEQYNLEGEVIYGIYDAKSTAIPAYQASISSGNEGYDVIINARNQQVVSKTPHVMHTNAEGKDLKGNTYQFQAAFDASSYVMLDNRFPINNYTSIWDLEGSIFSFEDNNYSRVQSDNLNSGWDPSAISVLSHFDSLITLFKEDYDYEFKTANGQPVNIFINAGEENATARASIFTFGKTDISNYANAKDVVAHELTHAIITATSNLEYNNQSGALNESFADLFGILASDDGNWLIGEDIREDGSYFRNMKNPEDEGTIPLGYPQPSHMDKFAILPDTKAGDWGGVHINSGIPNRFFYLLAEGNSNNTIGRKKTGIMAFDVLRTLNSKATFADFYQSMKAQAQASYGSNSAEASAVIEAGQGVGFEGVEVTISESVTYVIPSTTNAMLFLSPNETSSLLGNYDLNIQFYNSASISYNEDLVVKLSNSAANSRPSAGTIDTPDGIQFLSLFKKTNGSIGLFSINIEDFSISQGDFLTSEDAVLFNKISIDREFNKLAASLNDILSNTIQIYDIETGESQFIEPSGPSFTEGETGLPAELVDVVEFDPTGRFLAFDYQTTSSEGSKFWTIGILEVETGYISYPFSDVSAEISVGNPSFSNLNSDIVVFDAFFEDGSSYVYTINLKSGDVTLLANTKAVESESGNPGYPTLTTHDDNVIFSVLNDNNTKYMGAMPLDLSYEPIIEDFQYLNPVNEADYIRSVPFSEYLDTLTLKQDKTTFNFGDVTVNQSNEICLINESTHPIKINNSEIDKGVILSALPSYYNGGEKVCAPFTIDVKSLELGLFNLGAELKHNGTSAPVLFTFSGNKLLDSDMDSIPDSTDTDDDNDGVLDTADTYPLISIGSLTDTDSDGAPDSCDESCIALDMAADTDDDNDGLLDTADVYPLIAIGDLTDTDTDGAPDNCDESCIALGMAADTDDDNDGILDELEISNGLDPLDSADATLDTDNDGVSNIDEANAGSDISADDQPPVFTSIVSDVEVISTGLATVVELVNPTASDVNSDAVVTNDSNGEFPVGITTVTYTATDTAGNVATLTQQVNVFPYAVISAGRSLGDGQSIEIDVSLNDTPATYPVTADIIIGGTASEDDFTLSTTSISISEGLTQTVELTAVNDGFGDNGETVSLSLANLVNAGIKPDTDSEQIFTITEEAILPTISVSVVQDEVISRTVDKQSNVLFDINIDDPNGLESLVIDWAGISDVNEVDSSTDLTLDTSSMEAGVYVLKLSVTDNDVAEDNVIEQRITIKVMDALPELTTVDSDGDGVTDIEEGLGDSDNDGIADYLDNTPQINLQPIGETFAQAQDGVTLALGAAALAGDDNSIAIDASSLPEDTTYEVEEVFDFTLTGLAIGASYELVLPLSQVIPEDAVYRKLTDDGWVDFVDDANNALHSAIVSGDCPAINSELWEAGLVPGSNCLKLTIQDGSANDTDGLENGTVEDPSGIAVVKPTPTSTPTSTPTPSTPSSEGGSSGGSNTIQILWLLCMLGIGRRIMNS
jgi:Zn-dependent metalloprotease